MRLSQMRENRIVVQDSEEYFAFSSIGSFNQRVVFQVRDYSEKVEIHLVAFSVSGQRLHL